MQAIPAATTIAAIAGLMYQSHATTSHLAVVIMNVVRKAIMSVIITAVVAAVDIIIAAEVTNL